MSNKSSTEEKRSTKSNTYRTAENIPQVLGASLEKILRRKQSTEESEVSAPDAEQSFSGVSHSSFAYHVHNKETDSSLQDLNQDDAINTSQLSSYREKAEEFEVSTSASENSNKPDSSEEIPEDQDSSSSSEYYSDQDEGDQQQYIGSGPKVYWENFEFELNVDSDYFTWSNSSSQSDLNLIIPPIMADTKDDLEDDRTTLTVRVTAITAALNSHAPPPPTVAIPMTKERVEMELEDLQSIKSEMDQILKRTRRLFRGANQVDIDRADALNDALSTDWRKATLQAPDIKKALESQVISRVKIPKAEPPGFDGLSVNWPAFLDQFNSMVVTNSQVSPTDKLALLKKSFEKGTAHHIVQNFPLTDIDWKNAWTAVKARYNHEREIAYAHLSKLFDLTPIQSQTQAGIRNIIDTINEVLRALKNLNIQTDEWDLIIIYIIRKNLDMRTRTDFEKSLPDDKLHTLKVILDYLNNLATALGTAGNFEKQKSKDQKDPKQSKPVGEEPKYNQKPSTGEQQSSSTFKRRPCVFCSQIHPNAKCPALLPLTPAQRIKLSTEKKLCKNCLRFSGKNHTTQTCNDAPCGLNGCQGKHHHLLHMDSKASAHATTVEKPSQASNTATVGISTTEDYGFNVLLSTAVINITIQDKTYKVRALIDQGSQVNLMTEKLANRLKLKRKPTTVNIDGVGNSKPNFAKGSVSVQIQSNIDQNWRTHINCFILPEVTADKPAKAYDVSIWEQFRNLKLADDKFNEPGPVDMILGAQVFVDILGIHHIKGRPSALDTRLGYIIIGSSDIDQKSESVSTLTCDVDFDLARFWTQEEVPEQQKFSHEEIEVEDHFARTHKRTEDGRFEVSLPFVPDHKPLGESRSQAVRRLIQIEKKLDRHPDKKMLYHTAMNQHIQNGYLEEVPQLELKKPVDESFYLPHHYVEKDLSAAKFRIVFDGSAKSASGLSLNDTLRVGPSIQNDIVPILLRFREHKVAFTADIKKMYLQVRMHQKDQDFQRILWRESPNRPIKDYRFTVVTFGISSSPYLAIKSFRSLAESERNNYPLAYIAMSDDFYVDDLLSGDKTVSQARKKQQELRDVTKKGGFHLCKWSSNSPEFLASIPEEERQTQLPLEIESTDKIKTLGILWNPATDDFTFKVMIPPELEFTKRKVASYAAKTYDPTGFVQPVIIKAKIVLQKLWESKTRWDQRIPPEINTGWMQYIQELKTLEKIQIPRHVIPNNPEKISFHGFSDASILGYGAVIYIVGNSTEHGNSVHLLTSKSRVAPIKMVSIPRLELMGAVVLVKLMNSVRKMLRTNPDEIHYLCDSTVVLNQINKPSRSFKTFVGNRVSYISDKSDISKWHHVKTDENPADLVSRGVFPSELLNNTFWWNGPDWLRTNELPIGPIPGAPAGADLEEITQVSTLTTDITNTWTEQTIVRFNSLIKLRRVTVFILRRFRTEMKPRPRDSIFMSVTELDTALDFWIKSIQSLHFQQEIKWLQSNQEFPKGNKIKSLNPFIDSNGILRVGGRLNEADDLPEDVKHPALIPKKHHIVKLIIDDVHRQYKHAGPQLMTSIIRARFWIIGLRSSLNHYMKNCITCQKISAEIGKQMMGSLPRARISQARPFHHTGVDYAGPVHVLPKSGRGQKPIKSWIAVFICFTTKAVHLELVSELSTNAFIASLKRFTSRRGKPVIMYSDEGTNFTGAKNELMKFQEEMENIANHHEVASSLAQDGIHWKLNPPGAPHMGSRSQKHEASSKTFDDFR